MLKYYDKAMCSNNIQHNMTEGTKPQHTTNKFYFLKMTFYSDKFLKVDTKKFHAKIVSFERASQLFFSTSA